ncbi:class I SAM-dependent methyltransferase [Bacillus sp. SL00103]
MGNGHDTLYLADLVGPDGQVFAFDVLEEAIEQTRKRLGEGYPYVHLIHDGHEKLAHHLPRDVYEQISGAVFNLGTCPEAIKLSLLKLIQPLKPLSKLLDWLKPGGLIVLVIYHGHLKGKEKRSASRLLQITFS